MDSVQASIHLTAAPAVAWAAAQRAADLAAAMPSVDEAKVLATREEEGALVQTVRWKGWLEVGAIRRRLEWTEEDRWQEADLTCAFSQLEGSFKTYEGTWSFLPEGSGCKATISLTYDAGIPLVGPLIGALVRKIARQNLEGLLAGLAAVLGE